MNCKDVQRRLTDDTSSGSSAELRDHLAACEACRKLYRDLQSLESLSGELKRSTRDLPPFFAARVCSQIGKNRPRLVYLRAVALLGALVLVGIGVATLRDFEQSAADREPKERPAAVELEPGIVPTADLTAIDLHSPRPARDKFAPSPIVIESPSSGYQLEMPATIEVRQTQAENEFYLRNVSH